MAFKTILASLNDGNRIDAVLDLAMRLAREHDAHLIGLFVIPAIPLYSMSGFELTPAVFEAYREELEHAADRAQARFENRMQGSGLRWEWQAPYSSSSLAADATIEHAREADLVVIAQVDPDRSMVEREFAERVVMESGRPVLLVPSSGRFEEVGRNVVIGWNGKREAARAAFDAIPILKRSANVRVTWIDPQKTLDPSTSLPGAELSVALARHGINALAEGYPTDSVPEGVALQARAIDAEADLLVMGAYGHSRMREMVFGGATRFILDHMRLPVLMSH